MVLTSSRQDLRRWLTEKTGGDKAEPLLDLMARCKNKPFYCGIHPSKVVDCCTWHILIPPKTKADFPSPLYPFQQNIIQDLEQNKRIGIVKARGIGASELFLRYALHLALSKQLNGNFLFVTGVGHVLSTSLAR